MIMEPGKPVVIEHFVSTAEVHERWKKRQEPFNGEGWWGPSASHE